MRKPIEGTQVSNGYKYQEDLVKAFEKHWYKKLPAAIPMDEDTNNTVKNIQAQYLKPGMQFFDEDGSTETGVITITDVKLLDDGTIEVSCDDGNINVLPPDVAIEIKCDSIREDKNCTMKNSRFLFDEQAWGKDYAYPFSAPTFSELASQGPAELVDGFENSPYYDPSLPANLTDYKFTDWLYDTIWEHFVKVMPDTESTDTLYKALGYSQQIAQKLTKFTSVAYPGIAATVPGNGNNTRKVGIINDLNSEGLWNSKVYFDDGGWAGDICCYWDYDDNDNQVLTPLLVACKALLISPVLAGDESPVGRNGDKSAIRVSLVIKFTDIYEAAKNNLQIEDVPIFWLTLVANDPGVLEESLMDDPKVKDIKDIPSVIQKFFNSLPDDDLFEGLQPAGKKIALQEMTKRDQTNKANNGSAASYTNDEAIETPIKKKALHITFTKKN